MYFLMYFLAALDHYNSFRVVCVSLNKYFKGENLRVAKPRFFPLFPIVSLAKFFKKSKFKINYLLKNYQHITKFMLLTWLSAKVILLVLGITFWVILAQFGSHFYLFLMVLADFGLFLVSLGLTLGCFGSFWLVLGLILVCFGSLRVVMGPFGSFFESFWLVFN